MLIASVCGYSYIFTLGTNRYFRRVIAQFGMATSFMDCTNLISLKEAIQSNTKVKYFKSVILFFGWSL